MRGTGHPLVLTIDGKAELVVQDAAAYQKLLERVNEMEALDGIKRGVADFEVDRVTPLKQSKSSANNPSAYSAEVLTTMLQQRFELAIIGGAVQPFCELLPCGLYFRQHRLEVVPVIEADTLIPFCRQVCE